MVLVDGSVFTGGTGAIGEWPVGPGGTLGLFLPRGASEQ